MRGYLSEQEAAQRKIENTQPALGELVVLYRPSPWLAQRSTLGPPAH